VEPSIASIVSMRGDLRLNAGLQVRRSSQLDGRTQLIVTVLIGWHVFAALADHFVFQMPP
jgi:hypothetical protein